MIAKAVKRYSLALCPLPMSLRQLAFHANTEELNMKFEFRKVYMRKSYEYAKISDYELGKEITKGFLKDFFLPEGFFPKLIWEILKDPIGMLMDLPLKAIAKKPKGDQIGYDFTTLEEDEPFIYFKRRD
jgi:hypothetical protein